jgi:flagellar hook protein FlgE
MFTGVSGLLNQSEAMSVIGNNIANVNTVGFKGSRMLFSDVLSTTIGNVAVGQIGHGIQIQKVDTIFSQSSMETTTSPTDLFIQGKEFFAVAAPGTIANAVVPATGAYYTRAGSFRLDNTGRNLITPDNYNVLDSESKPIVFSKYNTTVAPKTAVDPTETTLPPKTGTAFDAATLVGYSVGDVVSVGGVNYIALNAQGIPTAPATLTSPASDTTNWMRGTFNSASIYAAGDVVTGADGSNYVNKTAASGTDPVSDTTNWELILDFQKVVSVSTKGELSLLYADNTGKSATVFYNGNSQPPISTKPTVFVATAKVPNPPGMVKVGGSLYRESGVIVGGSGTPVIGGPNGSTEQIISSNLELSNVDLALEFVKMIQTQRAYSANSKTVTTSDEMMQEVLNLKR